MWIYRLTLLLSINIGFLFLSAGMAQTMFPANVGDNAKYMAVIETPKIYLSGICMVYHAENDIIKGSLFNEFGISVLDFSFNLEKDKVKLHHVVKPMDKWYIRRVLRKDLSCVFHKLQQGNTEYVNNKYHLSYQFTPIITDE